MDKDILMWGVFAGVFISLMTLDLGVFHRTDRVIGIRESLLYSAGYIGAGLAFGGWVWHALGQPAAALYWTGFIVEKTLSVDNIFAISLVFSALAIPRKYQYRVLLWGILGSILMRGVMIGAGAEAVTRFHWVLYIFAAFLVFTGINMLFAEEEAHGVSKNKVLKFFKKHMRVTKDLHANRFTVLLEGKRWLTPLMLALVVVNCVDVIFAVDSVPAILSLTTDRYIVFTSNIFALLGLRALYFALDAMLHRFEYLKYSLSLVLIFIGGKIFVADFLHMENFPPLLSLVITVAILGAGILFSLYKTRRKSLKKESKK
jgi:tellurite resistance protein TerC